MAADVDWNLEALKTSRPPPDGCTNVAKSVTAPQFRKATRRVTVQLSVFAGPLSRDKIGGSVLLYGH